MNVGSIPTDRALTDAELQSVVCTALKNIGPGLVAIPTLTRLPLLAEKLGLTGQGLQDFKNVNGNAGASRKVSAFLGRLMGLGVLCRDFDQSDQHYFVSPSGIEFLENLSAPLDWTSADFVDSVQDPELKDRCGDVLLRSRKFDSMVRDAIAVLEDRLKKLPNVRTSKRRRDVAVNALSPDSGIYTLGEDDGQRQSAQLLY
jgi:hypothetical protein